MAIISVKMVSGWKVDQMSLKDAMKVESVGLARYEIDNDGTAELYFEQVASCFIYCH